MIMIRDSFRMLSVMYTILLISLFHVILCLYFIGITFY